MVAGAYSLSYLGSWDRRIAWTQEVEVAVSQDYTTARQPGWESKTHLKKKKKKGKKFQEGEVQTKIENAVVKGCFLL